MDALRPRVGGKQILVVEDDTDLRQALCAMLTIERYTVHLAENGRTALSVLQHVTPDLILADINMPIMTGLELCQAVRDHPRWVRIPFIFLTANDSPEAIHLGRALGVEDYVTKPFDNAELMSIINARLLRAAEVEIAQIGSAYLDTVNVLANTIEGRDAYTHGHVERVARHARSLAESLGWAPDHLRTLDFGARLHDLGKITVPDSILNKAGDLTPAEWVIMRQHPAAGARILRDIRHLQPALPYVLHHHERWDGSGYPEGLRGRDIPIEGRLLAIVDVYDALTTTRPYHPARKSYDALEYLQIQAGRLFDPNLVPIFIEVIGRLKVGAPPPKLG